MAQGLEKAGGTHPGKGQRRGRCHRQGGPRLHRIRSIRLRGPHRYANGLSGEQGGYIRSAQQRVFQGSGRVLQGRSRSTRPGRSARRWLLSHSDPVLAHYSRDPGARKGVGAEGRRSVLPRRQPENGEPSRLHPPDGTGGQADSLTPRLDQVAWRIPTESSKTTEIRNGEEVKSLLRSLSSIHQTRLPRERAHAT